MVKYRNKHDGSYLEQECRNERLEASGRYELVAPSSEKSKAPAEDQTEKE